MEFRVTPEEVRLAAQNCRDTAGRVEGYLGELRSYVTALIAEYQGSAAVAFQTLMAQYDRDSERLNNALLAIGAGLDGNAMNYDETEFANRRAYEQIIAGLPSTNL